MVGSAVRVSFDLAATVTLTMVEHAEVKDPEVALRYKLLPASSEAKLLPAKSAIPEAAVSVAVPVKPNLAVVQVLLEKLVIVIMLAL